MKKNIFTRILAIALVAMSIMAVAIPAFATYEYNGTVSQNNLPVYASTNTSSTVIGHYSMGASVHVTTCNNKAWFQVSYGNDNTPGYVRAKYIGILSGYASAVVANPSGNFVYLFSTPGNTSTGFKKLYNSTSITVLHESYGSYTRVSDGYHTGWILDSAIYYG